MSSNRSEWEAHIAERTRKQAQRIGSPVTRPELANVEFVSLSGGDRLANESGQPNLQASGNIPDADSPADRSPLTLQCREGGAVRQPAPDHSPSRSFMTSSAAPLRPLERDVLAGVLQALKLHPRVAWVHRFNVGGMRDSYGNNVRFGFVGCSDILGQMKNGRFLAVEVKRPGGQPTQAQVEFLGLVERSGGVAFIARDIDDVGRALAPTRGVA